jgi:Kef-type K+ transport system membrane component KefB
MPRAHAADANLPAGILTSMGRNRQPASRTVFAAGITGAIFGIIIIVLLAIISNDPFSVVILGPVLAGVIVLAVVLAILFALVWIGYRLGVSAVREGTLAAHDELEHRRRGGRATEWDTLRGRPVAERDR